MTSANRKDDKELFNIIRQRPGMFIGEPINVQTLFKFLSGYRFALIQNGLDDGQGFLSDKPTFHDWVAMKEGYRESECGWAYIIHHAAKNDEKEIALFFTYLDEYFARKFIILYEHKITQKDVEELLYFSDPKWTDERKKRWINASIQIISYDESKEGVFTRELSIDGEYLASEEFYPSYKEALKDIEYYFIQNKK